MTTNKPLAADGRKAGRASTREPSDFVTFKCPLWLKDKIVADAARLGVSVSAFIGMTLAQIYDDGDR